MHAISRQTTLLSVDGRSRELVRTATKADPEPSDEAWDDGSQNDESLDNEGNVDGVKDLDAAEIAAAVAHRAGNVARADVGASWVGPVAVGNDDGMEDGDQSAVAAGNDWRHVPVIMSAMACIPAAQ